MPVFIDPHQKEPTMSASQESRGTCLCGAVSIRVTLECHDVSICHCRMCQTWSGGPMFAVESDAPMTLEGEENVGVYASSDWAERGFCRQCGTHLFYRLTQGAALRLSRGFAGCRRTLGHRPADFHRRKTELLRFRQRHSVPDRRRGLRAIRGQCRQLGTAASQGLSLIHI